MNKYYETYINIIMQKLQISRANAIVLTVPIQIDDATAADSSTVHDKLKI